MEEEDLINRLKNREESAFKTLVEQYQHQVINSCLGILQDRAEAEDVAQDVFVEVYQSIENFRSEAKLSTWIYRIAINKALNIKRRQKRRGFIRSLQNFFQSENDDPREMQTADPNQPELILEKSETAIILKAAIDSLPANQKTAFILYRYEDLSYKEIAEVMNLSLSSVESLMHRSKINLQKKLRSFYQS